MALVVSVLAPPQTVRRRVSAAKKKKEKTTIKKNSIKVDLIKPLSLVRHSPTSANSVKKKRKENLLDTFRLNRKSEKGKKKTKKKQKKTKEKRSSFIHSLRLSRSLRSGSAGCEGNRNEIEKNLFKKKMSVFFIRFFLSFFLIFCGSIVALK